MLRNRKQKFEPLFERPCNKREVAPDTTQHVMAALHALTERVDRLTDLLESKSQPALPLTICEVLPLDERLPCGRRDV